MIMCLSHDNFFCAMRFLSCRTPLHVVVCICIQPTHFFLKPKLIKLISKEPHQPRSISKVRLSLSSECKRNFQSTKPMDLKHMPHDYVIHGWSPFPCIRRPFHTYPIAISMRFLWISISSISPFWNSFMCYWLTCHISSVTMSRKRRCIFGM